MRALLTLLLCGLFVAFPVSAKPNGGQASAPFLSAADCFKAWPTYDAWIDFIRAKNPQNLKSFLLPYMFPREDFDRALQNLDCRAVTYENDGLTIHGWMVVPKGGAEKKFPVLIYNRGGNGSFGALNFALLFKGVFPYAERGFLVLASQYRGVLETQPERHGLDQFGGDDVRDVTKLIELLEQIPQADTRNVFMLGASRGAMMSFMAARNSDKIRSMAVIGGPTDLSASLKTRPEMERVYRARIPNYAANKDQALADRSVVAWTEDLPADMPLLILHGGEDERVDVSNAVKLHERLEQLKRPNKLVIYDGDDHFLSAHREEAIEEVVRWFSKSIQASKVIESVLPRKGS